MKEIIPTFTITNNTIALIPAREIEYETIVLEGTEQIAVNKQPLQMIKQACIDYYTEYEARRKCVIHHLNFKQKTPIPLNFVQHICFFPTHSPSDYLNNHWISPLHIVGIKEISQSPVMSQVIFKNGLSLNIHVSKFSLDKQRQRAIECLYHIRQQHHLEDGFF